MYNKAIPIKIHIQSISDSNSAVKEGKSEMSDQEMSNISNFLNQQKNITEIGELQLALQESISIERMN